MKHTALNHTTLNHTTLNHTTLNHTNHSKPSTSQLTQTLYQIQATLPALQQLLQQPS
jgi:hypothetical protein